MIGGGGRQRGWRIAVVTCSILPLLATAATGMAPSPRSHVLTRQAAMTALESLPYQYDLRQVEHLPRGADAAVAGVAIGPAHTRLQFGVALGREAGPVPLPDTGIADVTYVPSAGFTFTDDVLEDFAPHKFRLGPNIHNQRQYRVVTEMVPRMETALCLAATGKKCGI